MFRPKSKQHEYRNGHCISWKGEMLWMWQLCILLIVVKCKDNYPIVTYILAYPPVIYAWWLKCYFDIDLIWFLWRYMTPYKGTFSLFRVCLCPRTIEYLWMNSWRVHHVWYSIITYLDLCVSIVTWVEL